MTILHAGEVGRFSSATNINDTDDFMILRNGVLLRVTAAVLAAYVGAENTTFKTITFADSPYTLLTTDDIILADATDGNIIINLLPAATIPNHEYTAKAIVTDGNSVTLTADGSELLDNAGTKVISGQFVSHRFASDGTQYWFLG